MEKRDEQEERKLICMMAAAMAGPMLMKLVEDRHGEGFKLASQIPDEDVFSLARSTVGVAKAIVGEVGGDTSGKDHCGHCRKLVPLVEMHPSYYGGICEVCNNLNDGGNRAREAEWYQGSDTGISSETIFEVMTGTIVKSHRTPSDASDFGRCVRLLEKFPPWRARLGEVGEQFPEWEPLVNVWHWLEELYESDKNKLTNVLWLDELQPPVPCPRCGINLNGKSYRTFEGNRYCVKACTTEFAETPEGGE